MNGVNIVQVHIRIHLNRESVNEIIVFGFFFSLLNSATEENNKLKTRYEQAKEEAENLVGKMKSLKVSVAICFSFQLIS